MKPSRSSPSWIPRAAAMLFFITAIALFALSLQPTIRSLVGPKVTRAQGATYLLNLTRTPTVDVGSLRYEILGLGQNADSGEQIVWLRSLTTNRVGGFAAGDKVFGGPVRVADIDGLAIALAHRGQLRRVELTP